MVLEIIGLRVIILKVLNWSIQLLNMFEKKPKIVTAFKDSNSPILSAEEQVEIKVCSNMIMIYILFDRLWNGYSFDLENS